MIKIRRQHQGWLKTWSNSGTSTLAALSSLSCRFVLDVVSEGERDNEPRVRVREDLEATVVAVEVDDVVKALSQEAF